MYGVIRIGSSETFVVCDDAPARVKERAGPMNCKLSTSFLAVIEYEHKEKSFLNTLFYSSPFHSAGLQSCEFTIPRKVI